MHPSIAEFPALRFYGGGLYDAPGLAEGRAPVPGFAWPSSVCRVCLVDCGTDDSVEESGRSRSNTREAEVLVHVLERCLSAGTPAANVAVITGYSAQQALLRRLVAALGSAAEGVKVDTVDGFQGAERDLVLVSTVRANKEHEVGFMRDPRRVNVLLTRARRGLIAFGDAATLEGEAETWRPWLQWVRDKGAVISSMAARAPPRTDAPVAVVQQRQEVRYIDPSSGQVWLYDEVTEEARWADEPEPPRDPPTRTCAF